MIGAPSGYRAVGGIDTRTCTPSLADRDGMRSNGPRNSQPGARAAGRTGGSCAVLTAGETDCWNAPIASPLANAIATVVFAVAMTRLGDIPTPDQELVAYGQPFVKTDAPVPA